MLIEEYRQGLVADKDYNCAEKIVDLSNQVWNLELPDKAIRLASGFGGGMGCGHLCGAIAGAVMILSVKTVETVARQSDIYELESRLLGIIEEKLGSLMCESLKAEYYTPETKCEYIVETVIEILEGFG